MSRIGKNPVIVPAGVEVSLGDEIVVKGPLGTLKTAQSPAVNVVFENGQLKVSTVNDEKFSNAMWGTMRANLQNMVTGVSKGFEKRLTLVGVGYRAQAQGATLNLSLGFSHPVVYPLPDGVKAECPTQTEIVIKGVDKQKIGQVASEIRAFRKPEPYKGKGVRYENEQIRRKVGKSGGKK